MAQYYSSYGAAAPGAGAGDYWPPSPPPTDGPNARQRLAAGLPPHSGVMLPLPVASYYPPSYSHSHSMGWAAGGAWDPSWTEQEREQGQVRASVQPGSATAYFQLDPSLPLPTPEEMDRAYAAAAAAANQHQQYNLGGWPQIQQHETVLTWEEMAVSSSAVGVDSLDALSFGRPPTADEPIVASSSSSSLLATTGLVSKEASLKLGGFTAEHEHDREQHERRWVDFRSSTGETRMAPPSFPPLPHDSHQLSFSSRRASSSLGIHPPPPSSAASFSVPPPPPSSTYPLSPFVHTPETPPSPSDKPTFAVSLLATTGFSSSSSSLPPPQQPKRLTLPAILAPQQSSSSSTSSSSSSKRPRRPSSPNHIPRPRNAFILFRQHAVASSLVSRESIAVLLPRLQEEGDEELPPTRANPRSQSRGDGVKGPSQINVSQAVGRLWRALPVEERKEWEARAESEKEEHRLRWPEYRFRPKKKVKGAVAAEKKSGKKAREEEEGGKTQAREDEESPPLSPLAPAVPVSLSFPSTTTTTTQQTRPTRSTFVLPSTRSRPPRPRTSTSSSSSSSITSSAPSSFHEQQHGTSYPVLTSDSSTHHSNSIDPSLLLPPLPPTSQAPLALSSLHQPSKWPDQQQQQQQPHEYHFGAQDLFAVPDSSVEGLFGGRTAR